MDRAADGKGYEPLRRNARGGGLAGSAELVLSVAEGLTTRLLPAPTWMT
jgi:hypothetical protein